MSLMAVLKSKTFFKNSNMIGLKIFFSSLKWHIVLVNLFSLPESLLIIVAPKGKNNG